MYGTEFEQENEESITPPQTPIDPEMVTTDSLEALQSDTQRKVMDIIDKLRRIGLNGIVKLPQLVVCGDQSSGKSSVLEAITEVPFPRKENLCTRFATEIVLRRDPVSSISTRITPDKSRPNSEQEKLRTFKKSIHDFSELPVLMEEATTLMGLGVVGQDRTPAFSRDVLSIEICGPKRPQLTLVDLPGLIHTENKSQTKQDVQLIRDLVEEYISNERTVILAIVSAKNDYANQIILDHCRRVDSKGSRTLGIITKPDFLRPGSENEMDWIDLALNRNIPFELGWHMVRNRADGELNSTFEERNYSERLFFSQGRYRDLPRDMVGVESLRTRLSRLLDGHLNRELPLLKKEVEVKLQETMNELRKLGDKRHSVPEQRMFLMDISMKINKILESGVKGQYDHEFFGSVHMNAPIDSEENIRRFRAVIQHLNLQFAENMRRYGQKFRISSCVLDSEDQYSERDFDNTKEEAAVYGHRKEGNNELSDELDATNLPRPIKMTRRDAISWVQRVLERSRGYELPGNFNPLLISQLFWEQSEPWQGLALAHIHKVADICRTFMQNVLQDTVAPDIASGLVDLRVEKALKSSLEASCEELAKIVDDKKRHPMTYNHYYTTTIQKQRQKKYSGSLSAVIEKNREPILCNNESEYIDFIRAAGLQKELESCIVQDMDKFSAEEALESQIAYYKDELKYFIGVVTKQVIERHLVDPLPSTITPIIIAGMTDEEVSYVAAEAPEIRSHRAFLEGQKGKLENGIVTFRTAMGGRRA
ncbi:hypothetical protein K432DRAFT_302637 [Lepidopterella palustris CBS 459.81]|uniref:Dynamin family protein n=1 Tax=Lepidopterella palustris CBS 459.81 TaxID=1314670 RepID=A0A8E2JDL0_9PEZI|nr:hypothetical protein K432DRAFT_302637 [Lepidopterella palustris CBS 459.81]